MAVRDRRRRGAVDHPVFARCYTRFAPRADVRLGLAAHRRELLGGLSGRVLEIGAGTGLTFPYYPREVSEVVALEPERRLRRAAVDAALRAGVPVDVVPGTAEALPVKSDAYDAAVACLVLCSVRSVPRALAELRRVLRPGGQLRFFEHVRSERPAGAAVQWLADRTVWPLLNGGCHTRRDPVAELRAAGFERIEYRRVRVPARGPAPPSAWHVLGTARKPAAD